MPFTIPNQASATYAYQSAPDSIDFAILAAAHAGNVVHDGNVVSAGSGMQVSVTGGFVTVNGYRAISAAGNLSIAAADSSNPRIDLVCCDWTGALAVTTGTAASVPVAPAIPSNSVVLAMVYVPAGVTSITSGMITDKRVIVPMTWHLATEFMEGTNEAGEMGMFNFNTQGTGTQTFLFGVASHPGILRLTTPASAFALSGIRTGDGTQNLFVKQDVQHVSAIVRQTSVTDCGMEFVLFDRTTTFDNQIAIYTNSIDGTVFYCTTWAGGASTITATTVSAVANNWYQLDILRLPSGDGYVFAINGTRVATHTVAGGANIPSTALVFHIEMYTYVATAKDLDVDFVGFNFVPQSTFQRWT